MTLDYRKSQPGDHAPEECANARYAYDRQPTNDYADVGGYHAGWGICSGTVVPTGSPNGYVAPFTQRALASTLPAKELAR